MRTLITALLLALLIPAPGFAQTPHGCQSKLALNCPGMRISVCPAGDFEPILDGCDDSDGYILVWIWDSAGAGIVGIPVTDFWMNACNPQFELCTMTPPLIADAPTGEHGSTTFSGHISAGGCIPEGGIWMSCQGVVILERWDCTDPVCVDVQIVSPDLNSDCAVNLSDLSFFGESYDLSEGDPNYNTCCDYNDDGSCNLSDFSFFGEHYGH